VRAQEGVPTLRPKGVPRDDGPESEIRRERATDEISQYFRDIIAERRLAPRSHVISMLITGDVDGQRLADELSAFHGSFSQLAQRRSTERPAAGCWAC
jgi:cytochrome P450